MMRFGPGMLGNPRPIGPLQPGVYVLEAPEDASDRELLAVHDWLKENSPEGVTFMLFGGGLRVVPTVPVRDEDDATVQHEPVEQP